MVTREQERENKKLSRITELAGKKMWVSSLIGSISGGFGAYLYCGRYWNIIAGLFISMTIGCFASASYVEEHCEYNSYPEDCYPLINIAPIFLLVAIIDNTIAISSAREKLKELQDAELPNNIEALKVTLLGLIQERGEATVRELTIITGFSETIVINALSSLEKEQLICLSDREDGIILYQLL